MKILVNNKFEHPSFLSQLFQFRQQAFKQIDKLLYLKKRKRRNFPWNKPSSTTIQRFPFNRITIIIDLFPYLHDVTAIPGAAGPCSRHKVNGYLSLSKVQRPHIFWISMLLDDGCPLIEMISKKTIPFLPVRNIML